MQSPMTHPIPPTDAPAHDEHPRRLVAVVHSNGRAVPVFQRRSDSLRDANRLAMRLLADDSRHSNAPIFVLK